MIKNEKKYRINYIPIVSTIAGLAVFTFILILAFAQASKGTTPGNKTNGITFRKDGNTGDMSPLASEYDSEMLAVFKGLDSENRRITLLNTESRETVELAYTGGTDIRDKFGQIISVNQLTLGTMVDIYYTSDTHKLSKLQVSTKAWEYVGLKELGINHIDKVMVIGRTKYKFNEQLVVLNEDLFTDVYDLAVQDELTVRGYDQSIWSITVTRGHGTVKLEDIDAFLGGSVTVGYEAMQQITEDLLITVREGNFNLTVENGAYSGTKNITVLRNKETRVSLRDLGPEPVKKGRVTFEINPFGADLFIDGELTNYANPIELPYGKHEITVSLGGYATYNGQLLVDMAGKKIKVSLPEEQSQKTIEVEETKSSTNEDELPATLTPTIEYNAWYYPGEDADNDDEAEDPEVEEEYLVDEEHMIYVQYPGGASVYLNGDYMGLSPGKFKKVIGSHVLTFIREGYETKSYTIDVIDDGLDMYIALPELVALN